MFHPSLSVLLAVLMMGSPALGDTHAQPAQYSEINIEGWRVFVAESLNKDPPTVSLMLGKLEKQLADVKIRVSENAVNILRETDFWLVTSDPYSEREDLVGLFFFSKEWMRDNDYDVQKHLDVQFNKRFAVNESNSIVFHELAHAYHARHLEIDDPKIADLFALAKGQATRAFDKCPRGETPYAFTDPEEFFATFSQAYFGSTCAYPNNRNIIKLYHPEIALFLKEVWDLQ